MQFLQKNKNILCFWGFLILGILIFFHQFIFSGFNKLPGSLMDARLINYILEHINSWVIGFQNHSDLFTMPFYYPVKNNLFFSDTFLSVAPIYIIYRFFLDPYISYGFFVMTLVILNYVSFYFLMKKILKIDIFWICASAYLFAFSLISYFSFIHPQMLTQFFTIFGILCLVSVNQNNSKSKNNFLFILSGILFGLQFYSSYYLGFFFYLSCIILSFIFLIFLPFSKKSRTKTFEYIKNNYIGLLLCLIAAVLLVTPLGYFYMQTGKTRTVQELYQAYNIFYSGSIVWKYFIPNDYWLYSPWYKSNFGYFTLLIGILGLFKFNKKFIIFIIIMHLFMIYQFPVKLPEYVYYYIFGAKGIRYWLRLTFMVLPFISLGVAFFLGSLKNKYIKFLLLFIIFLEQIPAFDCYGWKRTDEIRKMALLNKKIPKSCKVIKVTRKDDYAVAAIDSMWFAHYRKIYSRSGFTAIFEDELDIPNVFIPSRCWVELNYDLGHPINVYN